MPSRFWLSLAFVVAFGANPALAQSAPERVASPGQAMLKSGSTTPAAAQTNPTALDSESGVLLEQQARVPLAKTFLVLPKGISHVSYCRHPDCLPTVRLGDDPKSFHDAGGEIISGNGFAIGEALAGQ